MSDTLHNSILNAGDAVHPSYPTDFYLDPESEQIQWYTRTGAGIPAPAYHGIWVKVFQAPAGAIPESVVENLLKVEDRLIYDCENNFQGTEWDGRNHTGVWKDKPDYSMEFQFEIAVFWDPWDWFGPVLQDLKDKWESGMDAAQIIDSEDLGDISSGIVDRDQAIEWLEDKIQEWQEEAEECAA
jgi:hypothetical protein